MVMFWYFFVQVTYCCWNDASSTRLRRWRLFICGNPVQPEIRRPPHP
jgi:hypothetical protein